MAAEEQDLRMIDELKSLLEQQTPRVVVAHRSVSDSAFGSLLLLQ